MTMVNFSWLDLSVDLWLSIYDRLDNVLDRLFFSSVCSFFRSIEDNPIRLSQALLLINPIQNSSQTHQFFSLTNTKLYSSLIPELQGKYLCGSSNGWLLTMDNEFGDMNLLNPLTRVQILLPSISTFDSSFLQDYHNYHLNHESEKLLYVGKFTMSHTEDGFMVMAAFTYLDSVAFCQTGDTKWTILDFQFYPMQDVMNHNGMFCAIDGDGVVIAWDINAYKKRIARDITISKETFKTFLRGSNEQPALGKLYRFYLVESLSGELLKICRVVDYNRPDNYHTGRFRVYKLDKRKNWITVRSLGDQSLFLGNNQSICLSSLDHPEFEADCIYFTDDGDNWSPYGGTDVGVYSLKNRTFQQFYPNHPFWTDGCIWITPSLR